MFKKVLTAALAAVMILALCACGTGENTDLQQDGGVEAGQPFSDGDKAALFALLDSVSEDMQVGTAGSSLRALSLAGSMLDWYVSAQPGNEALDSAAGEYLKAFAGDADAFHEQMNAVYTAALELTGEDYAELLDTAGYSAQHAPWDMDSVDALFGAVYSGMWQSSPSADTADKPLA